MHRILVILTSGKTATACLEACSRFADALSPAEVTLIHIRPPQDPDLLPTEEVYTEERKKEFEGARDALFNDLLEAAAPWRDKGLPALQEIRGKFQEVARREASCADLVIVGAPHMDPEGRIILNCALLEAERPVVIMPRDLPAETGRNIAIAWAPGDAPQRAVRAIQPVLAGAGQVTVLRGTAGSVDLSEPPNELLEHLTASCTRVQQHVFELSGRQIGEALLNAAHEVGADLLVMGAFTHSRMREAIFGGATAEILYDLDMPVLMHH